MNATVLAMVPDTSTLGSMNGDARLDFESISFNVKNDNLNEPLIEDSLFSNFKSNCLYYDENSFIQKFSNSKYPLILNMNIQYLSSKFQNLKSMVLNFLQQNNMLAKNQINHLTSDGEWNFKSYDDQFMACFTSLKNSFFLDLNKTIFEISKNGQKGGIHRFRTHLEIDTYINTFLR